MKRASSEYRSSSISADRPYFTDDLMDRIAVDELRGVGLLPSSPEAIRIERFVEKRFALCAVQYEALDGGILGYTQFGPRGVEAIIVSRALSEATTRVAERRINSTLAHEAGHGLLHTSLFKLDCFPLSLFGDADVTHARILCRDGQRNGLSARPQYDGRWWELQANRMIGALLLPRPLVQICLHELLVPQGLLGPDVLPHQARPRAARMLADVFDVNSQVAEIRVEMLFAKPDATQLTL